MKIKLTHGQRTYTVLLDEDGKATRITERRLHDYSVWSKGRKRDGHYPTRNCLSKAIIDTAERMWEEGHAA